MTGQVEVPVAGACPVCGNPDVDVPEDYDEGTIVSCPKCGHTAAWAKFFSEPTDPSEGAS
jgi:endogenous inhibitor of DNA gyrase (YacG/DUF329 family)